MIDEKNRAALPQQSKEKPQIYSAAFPFTQEG